MMKIRISFVLAIVAGMAFATSAYAATAFFTGHQEQVQTVTFKMAWRCEYLYNGQKIYQIFEGSCPSSIEVQ
jgi:ABC-type glycerol-3-phosphate transport system substrate-binding protein